MLLRVLLRMLWWHITAIHSSQSPIEQDNAFLDLASHHLQSWEFQEVLRRIGREQ